MTWSSERMAGRRLRPTPSTAGSALEGPMFINSKRMQIQRGRGAELVARVGIYSPHCPLSFGKTPHHLRPLVVTCLHFACFPALLCPAHIQGGIVTLQTKHVLLSLEDRLSAETSCTLLCSSWLGILVNCSHRGRHFLPEATVSSP